MKKALFLTSSCFLLSWGNVGIAHPLGIEPEPSIQSTQETAEPKSAESEMTEPSTSDKPNRDSQGVSEPATGSAPMVDMGSGFQSKIVNEDVPVELLDRGARPRRKLRFRPEVGQVQRMKMQMTMSTDVKLNGRPMPAIAIPPIEFMGVSEITQVDRKGNAHMTFQYEQPTILESESENPLFGDIFRSILTRQFEQLADAKMKFVYDKRGQLKEMDFEFAGEADPMMEKLLKQLSGSTQQTSGVFPKKSVGIGAEWQAPQNIALQGMDVSQSITYKLLEMDEDQVTVGMEFAVEEGGSTFGDLVNTFPAPPGAEVDVSVFDISGDGTMTMNLNQLLATDMDLSTNIRVLMNMTHPDREDMAMEMDMTSLVTIIPEE